MKEPRIQQILTLLLKILCYETKENHMYWEKVANDVEHCFFHIIAYSREQLKNVSSSVLHNLTDSIIPALTQEAIDTLSAYMKKEAAYRIMYGHYITRNEAAIRLDLLSGHSIILECICEVLGIRLKMVYSDYRSIEFRPMTCCLRNGKAITLTWNKESNEIEEMKSNIIQQTKRHPEKINKKAISEKDSDNEKDIPNYDTPVTPDIVVSQYNPQYDSASSVPSVSLPLYHSDTDNNKNKDKKRRKKKKTKIKSRKFVSDEYTSDSDDIPFQKDEKVERKETENKKKDAAVKQNVPYLDTSDSEIEMVSSTKHEKNVIHMKRKASEGVKDNSQKKRRLGDEVEFDFLKQDLHLSEDSDEEEIPKLEPSICMKSKMQASNVKMECSDEVKKLHTFIPMATLFKDELAVNQENIRYIMTVVERIRKHVEVLSANTLPDNLETCTRCPQHCSSAVLKCTKDRRGPRTNSAGKKKKKSIK